MTTINAVIFEVIRNRLIAITEEMRVALQSVSGSPTVTEASDFFTGLFTPDGAVASMGFQVAYHAPVSGTFIRHIRGKKGMTVNDGDMFIGNDPYIAALHQNDVQMVAPIFAGDHIVAWAAVEAHETDVGGMDFASWSPKAKEIWQEGLRIPCVKLIDRGEMRDDVLEMIVTASRLPALLGLDIRAFIATLNVARDRVSELVRRYGADIVTEAMSMVIASSGARMRARIEELPNGEFHAADFLEHDGHTNVLYKLDCRIRKHGGAMTLDFSGSSKQSPGFINCTRPGLMGAVCGAVLPTLGWDMPWNQGALAPFEVVAPDGLICTATFPAPVGSATVETVWVTANATILALNKVLAASPWRGRAQGLHAGAMATFNLGGVNQFGEPFGLHLMDPIAAGGAAWPDKDGVDGGGPITSPVSCIADVEKNEQVVPLFYFHRRLARDTGGAGKYRGGRSAEVSLTLGGIERAMALVMTHGVEAPNGHGLAGGFPGATIRQTWGKDAAKDGRRTDGEWTVFPPKPGLMPMTNRDVFAVSWQGGGGYGDPLERDAAAVAEDVSAGAVSVEAAEVVYGVICRNGLDRDATDKRREAMRRERVGGTFVNDPERMFQGTPEVVLSDSLFLARDRRGWHVVTKAGCILCTGSTKWRQGAVSKTSAKLPHELLITLHDDLVVTSHYCPASGTLLAVDFHRKDEKPVDDVVLVIAPSPLAGEGYTSGSTGKNG
jgi:N-methylhydantoinase B